MAEDYVITDPEELPPPPPVTKYKVMSMTTDMEIVLTPSIPPAPPAAPGLVSIKLKDDTGKYTTCQYTGKQATDMIKWMNTANFSVNSMQKRVLQKLSQDGKIPPGTVQGSPDVPEVPVD